MAWRTGTKVGRTIYDEHDQLIGMMDTPELAAGVVDAVNGSSGKRITARCPTCDESVIAFEQQTAMTRLFPCDHSIPRGELRVRVGE